MTSALAVEQLDVIEQLLLAVQDGLEHLAKLGLHHREPALHRRVVAAVATATHAALDVAARKNLLPVEVSWGRRRRTGGRDVPRNGMTRLPPTRSPTSR